MTRHVCGVKKVTPICSDDNMYFKIEGDTEGAVHKAAAIFEFESMSVAVSKEEVAINGYFASQRLVDTSGVFVAIIKVNETFFFVVNFYI